MKDKKNTKILSDQINNQNIIQFSKLIAKNTLQEFQSILILSKNYPEDKKQSL